MLTTLRMAATALAAVVLLVSPPHPSRAATGPELKADILQLAEEWARIKYLSKTDSERQKGMDALGAKADALVARDPNRVDALIWDGIITSERASLTWGLTALNLATRARDTLIKAEQMDPKALDAGAAASLGVLYYRVPGFPIAWGDSDKARQYLEEAVRNAPNGRDAHYFYADFLFEQHEYRKAEQVLKVALALPAHPDRPVWDKYFPQVMQYLLTRVRAKL